MNPGKIARAVLALPLSSAVLALAGCAVRIPPPQPPDDRDPHQAWAANLERNVDDEGRIDFDGMAADSADLDAYVAWVAEVSPENAPRSFASPEAVVAYYANAYNALAMYNVIHSTTKPENTFGFFYRRRLRIGGRYISLYDLENDVIRPLGEERVHFALNCMVRSCPRLPRQPFVAERLDEQLEAAATEFFNSPRHVVVEDGELRLSKILDWYEADFLAVAPSLAVYVARYRQEPLPDDLRVRFIPYDWTLNQR